MTKTVSYALTLATGAFTGPMRVAQGAIKGFTSTAGSIGSAITGLASLPGLVKSIVDPLTRPITLSGDMEALETSFSALLKSAPAAKAMVKDLVDFADVTPFDPVPVAAAGKQLLAFSFAAKEVKPLLRDIGDLAAAMEKPIDEVAGAFGRLKAGDFGEAFERLRDFGISRLDLIGQGLVFDKSGSFQGSAEQALDAVRAVIRRKFGGGMADLSTTFRGLFSTFQGYWDAIQRSFGKPIMQALKPVLEDGTNLLKSWTPIAEQWGAAVGKSLIVIRDLFQSGRLWETALTGMRLVGATFVNTLSAGLQGAVSALVTGLGEAAGVFQKALGESGLWMGIGKQMEAVFLGLKATLLDVFADVAEQLPGFLGGGKDAANNLRGLSLRSQGEAGLAENAAMRAFASVDSRGLITSAGRALQNTGNAFQAGYANAGEAVPTGAMVAQLESLLTPLMQGADAFFAKQNGDALATQSTKETATNTRALLKSADQIIGNLRLISDKIGSQEAFGTFA